MIKETKIAVGTKEELIEHFSGKIRPYMEQFQVDAQGLFEYNATASPRQQIEHALDGGDREIGMIFYFKRRPGIVTVESEYWHARDPQHMC